MTEEVPRSDESQPLSEVQVRQVPEYVDKPQRERVSMWDSIPEGYERSWEQRITPELAILYADGVEDYNPWYEAWPFKKGGSPFGPAIAPPLLLSHWCGYFFMTEEGGLRTVGRIHTYHDSQILAPCPIGTLVRFHSKVVKKFIKRGRQYFRMEVTVEDTNDGKLLFKDTRDYAGQYKKVSE